MGFQLPTSKWWIFGIYHQQPEQAQRINDLWPVLIHGIGTYIYLQLPYTIYHTRSISGSEKGTSMYHFIVITRYMLTISTIWIYLPICLPICLPIYLSIYLSVYLSMQKSMRRHWVNLYHFTTHKTSLAGGFNPVAKNISRNGSSFQVGVNMKNLANHHLVAIFWWLTGCFLKLLQLQRDNGDDDGSTTLSQPHKLAISWVSQAMCPINWANMHLFPTETFGGHGILGSWIVLPCIIGEHHNLIRSFCDSTAPQPEVVYVSSGWIKRENKQRIFHIGKWCVDWSPTYIPYTSSYPYI